MSFIGGIQLATFVANLFLGFLVLTNNLKAKANRAFASFAFGMSGWILTIYLMLYSPLDTLMVGRIGFAFGSLMLAGLLWFTAEFPERTRRSRFMKWLAAILGVLFIGLSFSPYMILGAETRVDQGYRYIWGSFGKPYLAWLAFYFFSVLYTFIGAWRGVRRSRGIQRRQYRSLAIGLTLFYVPMLVTQIILPTFGDFRWNPLGPVFSIFALIFIAQSMLSYRAFDVRLILKWGLIFPAIISLIVAVLSLSVFLLASLVNPTYAYLIGGGLVALIYLPLYRSVDRIVSHLVSRGSFIFGTAVEEFSELIQMHLGLPGLQKALVELLQKLFQLERLAIITFAPGKTVPVGSHLDGYPRALLANVDDAVLLLRSFDNEIVESEEVAWRLQYQVDPGHAGRDRAMRDWMKKNRVSALVPLAIKGAPVALLLLGDKRSSEPLSVMDRKLLEVVRGSLAHSLANAARFEEMQKLYAQLVELDKAKSDFIRVVSHQFRTPLTAILWNAELALGQDSLTPEHRKLLAAIQQRSSFLNQTLNRIFSMLALENRQLTIERKRTDLREVAERSLASVFPMCQAKRVRISQELANVTITGDAEKLETVIHVLLENACAYSKANGRIEVKVWADRRNKQGYLRVTDHGIGIPTDEMPHIFEKFFRGEAAKKALANGTGISLYLARQLVEKQGGTLEVTSVPGKETAFTVALPLAKN